MTKKRIVHLIQSLDNGGCENFLLRSLPLLNEFEHIVITLKKRGELSSKFEKKNIKVILKNNLIKQLSAINPDLIITYLFHADMTGRLWIRPLTKYKVIPFLRTTYNHPKYWLPRLFEKLTKKFVKIYLANSEAVKHFYYKSIGVDENKIIVIPNGIDVKKINTIKPNSKLKQSLNLPKDNIIIICVANLASNKGHKYLLKAFEMVYCKYPKIKLLLAGDGKEKNKLLNQISNYQSKNNILFLGKRNDAIALLKISDIFILPTLFEGMSNALLEAMASKCAIITTDIPENRIMIDNATFVSTKNSQALTIAMNQLISKHKLRQSFGQMAFNEVATKYNLQDITQRWTFFLKNQLAKLNPPDKN